MIIYPVIGDFSEFSRALIAVGIKTPLIPFSDYPKDFTSLSALNKTIKENHERKISNKPSIPSQGR